MYLVRPSWIGPGVDKIKGRPPRGRVPLGAAGQIDAVSEDCACGHPEQAASACLNKGNQMNWEQMIAASIKGILKWMKVGTQVSQM